MGGRRSWLRLFNHQPLSLGRGCPEPWPAVPSAPSNPPIAHQRGGRRAAGDESPESRTAAGRHRPTVALREQIEGSFRAQSVIRQVQWAITDKIGRGRAIIDGTEIVERGVHYFSSKSDSREES